MKIFADAPVASLSFDALGHREVAARIVELLHHTDADQPMVLGMVGPTGCGKTSVQHMTFELLAERDQLRAFAIDAWNAGDAARVNETFLREIARVFAEAKITGGADKLRDRLLGMGDMVSSVARLAGVTVDVKGAFERTPDKLREEVMKLTEALGKRIVVFIDHIDRLAGAETLAVLKLVERWGTFPYFAFVLGYDRDRVVDHVQRIDGDTAAVDRVITAELAIPPVDRARLAAWVRGAVGDLAESLRLDPGPALGLFELDGGVGLEVLSTVRQAKRLLNALIVTMPLVGRRVDLRGMCLLELVRERAPAAYRVIAERLPLDANGVALVRAELARIGTARGHSAAVEALVERLLADVTSRAT